MTFTLGGAPISRATLRMPRYGAAMADVSLVEDPGLVEGQRATLAIGDLSLVGSLRPGGTFGGTASWTWIAGAGRWETMVDPRGYDDDTGVPLSRVLADLATDAGELGSALGASDRPLGTSWTRPRMLARDCLEALIGQAWWVDGDGITHAGPRPGGSVAPMLLEAPVYDPALKRAVVAVADDGFAQLLPGVTVTHDGFPAPLTVAHLVAHVEASSIEVELYGERGPGELLGAIIDARTAGTRFHALAPYAVKNVAGARASVESADARSVLLPGHAYLHQIPGVPGCTAVLVPGQAVLVAWPSGDPGSPAIVGFPAGVLPDSVVFDAATSVSLGAGAGPLAKGIACNTNFNAIATALAALGQPVTMVDVNTTKAKGA